MDKIIICITAAAAILLLVLASCLWYKCFVPRVRDDVIYVMHQPRYRLVVGIIDIVFFSFMAVISLTFPAESMLAGFLLFYSFVLLGIYFCITVFLWRCMIKEDSLAFYTPLLPAKEIKFYDIDFVHCTDNHTYGLSGQKTLAGYRRGKKLFSIEEDIPGFPLLCVLFYERGKIEYIPAMENTTAEKTLNRVPVVEDFSVTAKTGDTVRSLIGALFLSPCCVYIFLHPAEFELIYQAIAAVMLPLILIDLLRLLGWKITVDFRILSIRKFPGIVKTYEIRQITNVEELEHYIVLYAGPKKIVKVAKDCKNFSYLFERLRRTEAEISRKY